MLLDGKKLLITGVLTDDSIAFAVARVAQEAGAEILLTNVGRGVRLTEKVARKLPTTPDVMQMDVNAPDDVSAVSDELMRRWGRVDGVLHGIAFAPQDALGGNFLDTPPESAEIAFRTSAYSLKALAVALADLYPEDGAGIVSLDFDASVAWPAYDWMGVAKAALESITRYLCRDLGPPGIRVNCVAAGPLQTVAARGVPGFSDLATGWARRAPLGWDPEDPGPVADAVTWLLSDRSRGVTGEILHVDGGYHAMGADLPQA